MKASEIARKNYERFDDKKEITELINATFCAEADYVKRDGDGNAIEGEFRSGINSAVAEVMRREFVSNVLCSLAIRELCVDIIIEMQY